MLEKVTQIAEQAATNGSRRQFLGRFGRGAAATAAALGGFLALPTETRAAKRGRVCNGGSSACTGQLVGSPCSGANGTCHAVHGDRSDNPACYCRPKHIRGT